MTLARIDELTAQLSRPLPGKAMPFGEAVRAVLAGPQAVRQPPKQ